MVDLVELDLPTIDFDVSAHSSSSRKSLALRRESLLNEFGGDEVDDDDEMRAELDRLSIAQVSLQHELMMVMKMVETMQTVEETYEEQESQLASDLHVEKPRGRGLQKMEWTITSTRNLNVGDNGFTIEEEAPTKRKGFASGFFDLLKPKESLETQRKKQKEVVHENLKIIEPGLEDLADCAEHTQEILVHENASHRLQELMKQKPGSLEEEKKRQEEILRLTLSPELLQEMNHQQAHQAQILADKKEELRVLATKKSELDYTKREIRKRMESLTTSKVKRKSLTKASRQQLFATQERAMMLPTKRMPAPTKPS